jgi:hypothetical protein
MILVLTAGTILLGLFFSYVILLRRRDATARRAWESYCNEQAVANDAARAARRAGLRPD